MKRKARLGMAAHAWNPSASEAEEGKLLQARGKPGLGQNETSKSNKSLTKPPPSGLV
ncbi:hypothetical protein ACRRTK_020838 [Alexandromys fortis]